MRAYVAWERVSGLERPGAWVRRVLINLCTDVTRRRSRERAALARSEHDAPMTVLDAIDSELWRSVRRLPRPQRGAVMLHYLDNLSVAENADVLGVSSGSVKSSLSRARSALAPSRSVAGGGLRSGSAIRSRTRPMLSPRTSSIRLTRISFWPPQVAGARQVSRPTAGCPNGGSPCRPMTSTHGAYRNSSASRVTTDRFVGRRQEHRCRTAAMTRRVHGVTSCQ